MTVTVYGTEGCSGCTTLKTQLDNAGIKYQYKDVMDDESAKEVQKHRIRSLPTTVVTHEDRVDFLVGSGVFNAIKDLCSQA
jgi:glutaredoxin